MRLIDADSLIETMRENAEGNEGWYGDTWAFMRDVENAPTIDAVPVVRCKDCRWRDAEEKHHCIDINRVFDQMDFCSFAERKDNEII